MKKNVTSFIVKTALLAAIGVVLTLIEFPLPFMPPFLQFNVADIPSILAGFAGGPWMAVAVVLLKNILFTAIRFSTQQLVGCAANILIGLAYALPAAILYKKHHDRKHAVIGMLIGSASMILTAIVANWFILIPAYAAMMHVDIEGILAMTGMPVFGSMAGYLLLAVLPFNLLRSVVMSLITRFIYKPLSPLLHK